MSETKPTIVNVILSNKDCICCKELRQIVIDNLNNTEELAAQIRNYFGFGGLNDTK